MLDDLATYMQTNSLGTLGTTLFEGYLPNSPDDCLAIYATGGVEPDHYLPTKVPTFQVLIRSSNFTLGNAKLTSVRSLFENKVNTTIGSTYFYYILAIAEGGHLGRDDNGRDTFSINFKCKTR